MKEGSTRLRVARIERATVFIHIRANGWECSRHIETVRLVGRNTESNRQASIPVLPMQRFDFGQFQ